MNKCIEALVNLFKEYKFDKVTVKTIKGDENEPIAYVIEAVGQHAIAQFKAKENEWTIVLTLGGEITYHPFSHLWKYEDVDGGFELVVDEFEVITQPEREKLKMMVDAETCEEIALLFNQ